jgi:putative hydrolase of the HAD superfamily
MRFRWHSVNVVFDLGGVVLTWDPGAIVSSVFPDPAVRALVLERVFGDPDWTELDRGTIPRWLAIERAALRTGIDATTLEELFSAMLPSLVPVPDVVQLIEALRTAGNRLYVLSNLQRASLAYIEATYDIFALFDGRVVSCEIGACKPELAIYRHLLEAFALDPAVTVFIDDVQDNLDAAAALGMHTVRFTTVEACRATLIAFGCL